jgi:hypothetical protein
MESLDWISDIELKNTIEESLNHAFTLFEESNNSEYSNLYS